MQVSKPSTGECSLTAMCHALGSGRPGLPDTFYFIASRLTLLSWNSWLVLRACFFLGHWYINFTLSSLLLICEF